MVPGSIVDQIGLSLGSLVVLDAQPARNPSRTGNRCRRSAWVLGPRGSEGFSHEQQPGLANLFLESKPGFLFLGVDSSSILFSHGSLQKPDPFPQGFWWFSRKKDPWKEWKWKLPLDFCCVVCIGGFVLKWRGCPSTL